MHAPPPVQTRIITNPLETHPPVHTPTPLPRPAPGPLRAGTDVSPIVPALEKIWADSLGQSLADFNFRTVRAKEGFFLCVWL